MGEGNAGADAAGLVDVYVGVERLPRHLPAEARVEAQDGAAQAALRRDDAVPTVAADAAAPGHVALSREHEDERLGRLLIAAGQQAAGIKSSRGGEHHEAEQCVRP